MVYPWRGREEEGEGGRVGVRTSACCSSLHLPSGLSVLTGASLPDLTLHTHTQAASIMHTETSLYLHTCTLASKCTLTDTTVFLYKPLWSLRWWFWSCMPCAFKPGIVYTIWTLPWGLQLCPEASWTHLQTLPRLYHLNWSSRSLAYEIATVQDMFILLSSGFRRRCIHCEPWVSSLGYDTMRTDYLKYLHKQRFFISIDDSLNDMWHP